LDPICKYKAVASGRPKTAKTIGRTKTIQVTLNPDWRAQKGDNGFKIPALADFEAMAGGDNYEDLLVEVRLIANLRIFTIYHSPFAIHHSPSILLIPVVIVLDSHRNMTFACAVHHHITLRIQRAAFANTTCRICLCPQIWDWDMIGSDDFLGMVILDGKMLAAGTLMSSDVRTSAKNEIVLDLHDSGGMFDDALPLARLAKKTKDSIRYEEGADLDRPFSLTLAVHNSSSEAETAGAALLGDIKLRSFKPPSPTRMLRSITDKTVKMRAATSAFAGNTLSAKNLKNRVESQDGQGAKNNADEQNDLSELVQEMSNSDFYWHMMRDLDLGDATGDATPLRPLLPRWATGHSDQFLKEVLASCWEAKSESRLAMKDVTSKVSGLQV
jgi:hypothetical protein